MNASRSGGVAVSTWCGVAYQNEKKLHQNYQSTFNCKKIAMNAHILYRGIQVVRILCGENGEADRHCEINCKLHNFKPAAPHALILFMQVKYDRSGGS